MQEIILGNHTMFNIFRVFKGIQFWKPTFCQHNNATVRRNFADIPVQNVPPKQVQGTESEKQMRVRRARPGDVPRVLLFVRENARAACPGMTPVPVAGVVMSDYVARALAQGHSMLAEQQESRRGFCKIRGLALTTVTSPWDAGVLERWARCLKCPRSRQMLAYTAHCLRAPGLHDKYRVHKIMQVNLIVPPELPKNMEIVKVLTKHAINRGRDVGCPLLRFDVTSTPVANALDELKLFKKEWQLTYDIGPSAEIQCSEIPPEEDIGGPKQQEQKGFFKVYTVKTN